MTVFPSNSCHSFSPSKKRSKELKPKRRKRILKANFTEINREKFNITILILKKWKIRQQIILYFECFYIIFADCILLQYGLKKGKEKEVGGEKERERKEGGGG